NRVTSLAGGNDIPFSTGGLELSNITAEGYSAASLYGVRVVGVNPENGRRIFLNSAGEQVQYLHLGGANAWTYLDGRPAAAPNTNPVILGNTIPTWFGGFNNSFQYRNVDLALNFTFSGGNYSYNGSRAGLLDQRVWNNSVDVLNAWTTPGQVTDIPMAVYGDNVSNGSAWLIDSNVEKGDFLRLQTATLGYRLPTSIFGNSGINSVRLYASVNNAFILTGYTGVDPEISSNGNENFGSGVERNTIPQGRLFTFGVNIGF